MYVLKYLQLKVPSMLQHSLIINKYYKLDYATLNNMGNSSPQSSKSKLKCISDIEISPNKITVGQGEYVVFHTPAKELDRGIFDLVYKIINQYSPSALINSESEEANEHCVNRYELIRAKVQEIDSSLDIIFVPRTLYELIFIRKCIKEDVKHKSVCPRLSPFRHTINSKVFAGNAEIYQKFLEQDHLDRVQRKCWHLSYFVDAGDNHDAGVKDVAYRLNQLIVKMFSRSSKDYTHGFTCSQFIEYAEREIEFLKAHYRKGCEEMEKLRNNEKIHSIGNCVTPGPTTNFGYESSRGSASPMGIRNDTDAQIIRAAISLDCSEIARHSFILYRGAIFERDLLYYGIPEGASYSLSYGTSLFAGCVYDGGATAFYHMRKNLDGYVIPIPFAQSSGSLFNIPPNNTITQLFGEGENFRVKTKSWKDIQKINIDKRDELIAKFQDYKNQAIQLK